MVLSTEKVITIPKINIKVYQIHKTIYCPVHTVLEQVRINNLDHKPGAFNVLYMWKFSNFS